MASTFLNGRWQSVGQTQWAPTLTAHDPNPPITLEGDGQIVIAPPSITSTVTFGAAIVSTALVVSPPSIGSTLAFGTAIVSTSQIISPPSITSGVTFGTATIGTALLIQPPSIGSGVTFGAATVTTSEPPVPPPPPPVTFQRLVVECKTLTCDGVSDTSLYSLQDAIPSRIVAAAECKTNDCVGIEPDSASYSLQDALLFNGTPVTVPVTCPPGANCIPGSFPPTVTYPPGTFVFPDVPQNPGEPINLCLKGCQSTVCRYLPAGSSQAAIQAAANEIIAEVAAQQAQCDFFPEFPFGTSISLTDLSGYACLGGAFIDDVDAIITPSSYPATFSIIGGSLPDGIVMSQNGTTAFFTGIPTTAGASTFTLRATAANGVSATRAYTTTVVGITTATPLPDAIIGEPYSETLTAVGITGTVIWGIASGSLPDGLTLDPTAGVISGTPTTSDAAAFTVFVQNSERQCTKAFTIPSDVCLITTASPLPDATEGVAYSTTLAADDITGTLTWSIILGSLPDGLVLNTATGHISGTPTTVETANFTVRVENGTGNICSKPFQLEVVSAAVCPDESYSFSLSPLIGRSEPGCLAATSDITSPNRMFVPTQTAISENRVSVFDTDTNGLIGTIVPSTDFLIRGIAYYPASETAFMAYNKITAVTEGGWLVYDAVGLGLITTIAAPALVNATTVRDCLYDATTALVYSYGGSAAAGNPRNGYLVSINPATNSVVSTVAVNDPGGFTDFGAVRSDIAICESLSRLYIAITTGDSVNDFSRVEIVSLPALGSLGSVSIAPWGRVFIIGVAQDTNKLYVMASNLAVTEDALIIIDLNTNSIISTTSYGSHEGWASFAYISDKGQVVIGRNESGGAAINFYVIDTTTDETVCVVPSISIPVTGAAAMIYNPTYGEINTYVDRVNRIDVYFY